MAGAVQSVLLAGVLTWAAAVKIRGRGARRSALSRLVGKERVVFAFRVIGVVELVLAASLLVPNPVGQWAALVWFLGLLGYLGWALVRAPESSCGCLSEKYTPVSVRSLLRAGFLACAAAFAGPVTDFSAGLFAAELAVVVLLSSELDDYWLIPVRRWRVRMRHPLAGEKFEVPVESSVQQLHKSPAYRSVYPLLRSDLLDSWDEGEWRILTYSALREGDRATAVFAVPRLRYEPNDVRVALA